MRLRYLESVLFIMLFGIRFFLGGSRAVFSLGQIYPHCKDDILLRTLSNALCVMRSLPPADGNKLFSAL